jgi:tripartite-type tricarboxylate transporter receptor subunit TctC
MMENALRRVHASALWKEYSSRTMLEDLYLSGPAFAQFLAKRREEMDAFLAYLGQQKK